MFMRQVCLRPTDKIHLVDQLRANCHADVRVGVIEQVHNELRETVNIFVLSEIVWRLT
jgi:hypothetical protein